jgi:hypothetical protein
MTKLKNIFRTVYYHNFALFFMETTYTGLESRSNKAPARTQLKQKETMLCNLIANLIKEEYAYVVEPHAE